MAGLQDIINKASSIQINRRKVVGIQITRNEIPRTSLTPTRNPWRFTVEMPPVLSWYNNRNLVEYLDNIDRYSPQIVNFSNTCINWIYRYQGNMTNAMINGLVISNISGTNMTLSNLLASGVGLGRIMFQAGDSIQIGNNPYPFTSVNTVTATGSNTITFQTSRPMDFVTYVPNVYGINGGVNCNFNVFCPNMPTYRLVPGNPVYNGSTLINNARIEFSEPFELYEWVGGAG